MLVYLYYLKPKDSTVLENVTVYMLKQHPGISIIFSMATKTYIITTIIYNELNEAFLVLCITI